MSRVIVAGFDSPLLSMFEEQIATGELEAIASLVERGRVAYLRESQDALPSISWPTMVAGVSVTEHELLYAQQLVPGSYRTVPTRAEDAKVQPFWGALAGTDRRLTLLSMYGGAITPEVAGTQVAGWNTHDPYNRNGPFANSEGVLDDLVSRFGKGLSFHGIKIPSTLGEYESYADLIRRAAQQYGDAAVYMADSTEWDLLVLGYNQPHEAGHFLSHLADPTHPRYRPEASDRAKDALRDVNRIVDRSLRTIIERHPDATVVIATPYTLGKQPHLDQVPRRVLERAGLLFHAAPGSESIDIKTRVLRTGRSVVRRVIPAGLRPALGKLVPRDRWIGHLDLASIDWSKTMAFDIPEDGGSALRFNLSGREPEGIVEEGAGYQDLVGTLREVFGSLRDASTGEPVVRKVLSFEEAFAARPGGPFPDVLVDWVRTHPVAAIESPELGLIEVPRDDRQSATHDAPGFAIMAGEGVEHSPTPDVLRIRDVGPRIIEALDLTG